MSCGRWQLLTITDGTTYIDLLSTGKRTGFHCADWQPSVGRAKEGGVWQDSPLADGRRLAMRKRENVSETFRLQVNAFDRDTLVRDTQELRRLLEKAVAYWTSEWQNEPVWVEAQGLHESNPRYSLVMDYETPRDEYPYTEDFWNGLAAGAMRDWTLGVEREPCWRDFEPGSIGDCDDAGEPYYLIFDGDKAELQVSDNAAIQDLHGSAFTAEAWVRADEWGESGAGRIFDKSDVLAEGWLFTIDDSHGLRASAAYATGSAISRSGTDDFSPDSEWHHVAATLDYSAGSKTFRLWIDGIEVSYTLQQDGGAGAATTDVGNDLYIGNASTGAFSFDGGIGWCRLSSGQLYMANFTPPARCALPGIRASTIAQWVGPENSGTTIDNQEGTAALDGTQTDCDFGECPPDDCACVEISGMDETYPFHLEFRESTSVVNCGSDPALDNLHGADFTAEAWIRADSWGDVLGRIFDKRAATSGGWRLFVDSSASPLGGIRGEANYVTTEARSASGVDDFLPDGEWHHVAMTLSFSIRTIRLFIDGVEPSYATQQVGNGVLVTDALIDLYIGNRLGNVEYFDGGIGWCRISDNVRYTADFVPPLRCVLPDIDVNTVAQWIGPENSGATIDNQEGTALLDGTQTDCDFDADCPYGRNDTCSDEVYIANKHNRAQITHLFYDDAGVWSQNLLTTATPYRLLPAVPAANDAVYFGIDTTFDNSGPFCSLVFDIQTAVTGITGTTWEYYSSVGPGWVAFAATEIQDNTDADGAGTGVAFDTVGVGSVHWEPNANWITRDISIDGGPAVTGYWVRLRVTAAAGATAPTQQNRNVYTILWPCVDVGEEQIGGDVEALARIVVRNQSDTHTGASGLDAWANRVIVGARSLSRGEDFDAYINLADEQNQLGISLATRSWGAFANNVQAPTGRQLAITNASSPADYICVVAISSDPETDLYMTRQYDGIFHMFMRGKQTSGSAGDIELWITAGYFANEITHTTARRAFETTNDWQLLDFGRVTFNTLIGPHYSGVIFLQIWCEGDGAVDAELYDIILMPVDEYAGDYIGSNTHDVRIGDRGIANPVNLDIDNVLYPKRFISVVENSAFMIASYQSIGSASVLQANADQRVWFLTSRYPSTGNDNQRSEQFVSETVQAWAINRYLSQRGNR